MPSTAFAPSIPQPNWDVEEGTAQEIAPRLKHTTASALVFLSHSRNDEERTRLLFETLKRACALIDELMTNKQEQNWKALLDALTPDVPLSTNRVREARMLVQAQKSILESDDFVRAIDLAELGHLSKTNPSSQPNRWKKGGQVFAVSHKGTDLFPLYAFDLKEGVKPLPIMKEILHVLGEKTDWQKAFWFSSVNTYLKNKAPKDLLASQPEKVLRAAEREAEGIQHG